MADSFAERTEALARQVGDGELVGELIVDQAYAHYQHHHLGFRHPRGGQAMFLHDPLYERADTYLRQLADAVLHGDLTRAMADAMEDLSGQVDKLAPRWLDNLRESGHPLVHDRGTVVYDRAPIQPRLSEDELRALKRAHPHWPAV